MIFPSHSLTRREFLSVATPLLGVGLWSPAALGGANSGDGALDDIPKQLLGLVNEERFVAGVPRLEMDDLASRVASAHAIDMATGNFISHWGRNGRKPYHRYSFAGGIHATFENVASIDNVWSVEWKDLARDLTSLHMRMHAERPPNDGHRKAILAPQQTHVGFGVAIDERKLRLVEMYVAKHLEVRDSPSRAKRKTTVELSARLLNRNHILQLVEVYYEPLPKPPNERFLVPVKLFKDSAGIYTIVCWIKRNAREKAFPATEICIEAE
ncbi:MAG: CAP domain-containing protein [Pyrinomonadaceae bacterium]